jgi:D-galactarolactone cycloisomerase
MRIEEVKTHKLVTNLREEESFAYSQHWYKSRSTTIVEIRCDNGLIGYGEGFGPPAIISATIDSTYAPLMLGRDPLDRETLWLEMYNLLRDHGRKGAVIEAISAVDIALWDLAGKHYGVSVSRLAGRPFRDEVGVYATGFYRNKLDHNIDTIVDEALGYVDEGFPAMKVKIGFVAERDIAAVAAIREAVGEGIGIMVDANHAYELSTATTMCEELRRYDVKWFEEPLVPEDLGGYRTLRSNSPIPISAGEAEFTRYGFRELISTHAVDIIQPDCCAAGGLTECLKIADLADTWHLRCIPHAWGSGIALAATLHLLAMIAPCPPALLPINEPVLELDRTPNIFRERLVAEGLEITPERAKVPTGPGLGIRIDERILQKYCVDRD